MLDREKKLNLWERETESYGQNHCRELSQGGDFHLPGELPAHIPASPRGAPRSPSDSVLKSSCGTVYLQ